MAGGKRISFSSYEFTSSALTHHASALPSGDRCVQRKQSQADKHGLPLRGFQPELLCKGKDWNKGSKGVCCYTFPNRPTESIALHWSVVSMATKTAGNWPRFLSGPLARTFSLQQRPLHTKWRIAPRHRWKQSRGRDHCRKTKWTQTSVKMKAKKFNPVIELFD